jgi:hypothetical protein
VTGSVRAARALAAVLVVAALAGCGTAAQDDPTALPSEDVPFGLLDPSTSTPTSTAAEREPTAVSVFLVGANGLAALPREVPSPPTLQERMDALAEGPTGAERALGVRTALPPLEEAEQRVVTRADDGTALVELTEQFDALSGTAAVTALAQIVYTLTEDARISRVRFLRDGREITVPRADLTRAATVTRADYPLAFVARDT